MLFFKLINNKKYNFLAVLTGVKYRIYSHMVFKIIRAEKTLKPKNFLASFQLLLLYCDKTYFNEKLSCH